MDRIDWTLAQRVGEVVAGTGPAERVFAEAAQPLAEDFAKRVSEYTGLALPMELPPLEAVDRPEWIAANLSSMRPLMEKVAERLQHNSRKAPAKLPQGWALGLPEAMRVASGLMLGAQVGAMAGLLSQRVLGQYELELLEPSTSPRLLLVAPNLAQAAQRMQVQRDELLNWVTIHEITHAIQFSGAPWLRGHLAAMIEELLEGLEVSVSLRQMLRLPSTGEVRELAELLRRGEVMRVALGRDRWLLLERMQATMSLIEGHAEHVMDAVGAEVLPSLTRLRGALQGYRESAGLPWRIVSRLLGLDMKMRQYDVGKRFCDEVVAQAGPQALTLAWASPQNLPTAAEFEAPRSWLERVGQD
jgi:coenzyme F420 biosynthesis associated uncharacterized protein